MSAPSLGELVAEMLRRTPSPPAADVDPEQLLVAARAVLEQVAPLIAAAREAPGRLAPEDCVRLADLCDRTSGWHAAGQRARARTLESLTALRRRLR